MQLVGRAAADLRFDDEAAGPDALHVERAAAVLDDPHGTDPEPVDLGILAEPGPQDVNVAVGLPATR